MSKKVLESKEKMTYTNLDKSVRQKCIDSPNKMDYVLNSNRSKRLPSELLNVQEQFKNRDVNPNSGRWSTKYKNMIIYAVINGGVYDHKIVEGFGVTRKEIEDRYNLFIHFKNCLEGQTDYFEFVAYIYQKAKEAEIIERERALEYEKAPLLNHMIDQRPPKYWSKAIVSKANCKLRDLETELKNAQIKFADGLINLEEFNTIKSDLHNEGVFPRSLRSIELKRLERNRPKEERKNFMYINCISETDLISDKPMNYQKLILGTVSKIKDLLKEYCRWFNSKYIVEIEKFKMESRKAKQKIAYQKKSAPKQFERLAKRKEQQTQIIELFREGMAVRQISIKTGIGYGTVRRILDEIISLIENQ